MHLDHVLLAASALGPDGPRLARESGLEATIGGRHPGWGTANWIVALGDAYLELVAVVDEDEARATGFGRWILEAAEGQIVGWAVRPDDIDATVSRLGLDVSEGSRRRPSGELVEWRMAGLDDAMQRPGCRSSSHGVSRRRSPEQPPRLPPRSSASRSSATRTSSPAGSDHTGYRSPPGRAVTG